MVVIGIVGGIASGKSAVARMLQELGARVIDADAIGHEVLEFDSVKRAIERDWGDTVFGEDGRVDRRSLARVVFASPPEGPKQLAILEQITHPIIGQQIQTLIDEYRAEGVTALVLDAPVLLKAGWATMCDQILFVDVPQSVRFERAMSRGWSKEDYEARQRSQLSLELKKERSSVVIDNSGTLENTRKQLQAFWMPLL